jgi:hypothetical protein
LPAAIRSLSSVAPLAAERLSSVEDDQYCTYASLWLIPGQDSCSSGTAQLLEPPSFAPTTGSLKCPAVVMASDDDHRAACPQAQRLRSSSSPPRRDRDELVRVGSERALSDLSRSGRERRRACGPWPGSTCAFSEKARSRRIRLRGAAGAGSGRRGGTARPDWPPQAWPSTLPVVSYPLSDP